MGDRKFSSVVSSYGRATDYLPRLRADARFPGQLPGWTIQGEVLYRSADQWQTMIALVSVVHTGIVPLWQVEIGPIRTHGP